MNVQKRVCIFCRQHETNASPMLSKNRMNKWRSNRTERSATTASQLAFSTPYTALQRDAAFVTGRMIRLDDDSTWQQSKTRGLILLGELTDAVPFFLLLLVVVASFSALSWASKYSWLEPSEARRDDNSGVGEPARRTSILSTSEVSLGSKVPAANRRVWEASILTNSLTNLFTGTAKTCTGSMQIAAKGYTRNGISKISR